MGKALIGPTSMGKALIGPTSMGKALIGPTSMGKALIWLTLARRILDGLIFLRDRAYAMRRTWRTRRGASSR